MAKPLELAKKEKMEESQDSGRRQRKSGQETGPASKRVINSRLTFPYLQGPGPTDSKIESPSSRKDDKINGRPAAKINET